MYVAFSIGTTEKQQKKMSMDCTQKEIDFSKGIINEKILFKNPRTSQRLLKLQWQILH